MKSSEKHDNKTNQKPCDNKNKPNVLEMAKKKRHIHLLEKIQSGKTLTNSEIRELQRLEGHVDLSIGMADSQEQVAKAFKVSYRTVQRWMRDGMPVTPEGQYDLIEIQAWRLLKNQRPQDDNKAEKEKWDTEFVRFKALIMEIEYKKKKASLISREEVERDTVRKILTIKTAFLAMAHRVAPQLVGRSIREMHVIIDKRIKEILQAFAEGREVTYEEEKAFCKRYGIPEYPNMIDAELSPQS